MGRIFAIVIWGILVAIGPMSSGAVTQDDLPDDHLLFVLRQYDDRLEGGTVVLEGFGLTMDVPRTLLGDSLTTDGLLALVRERPVSGTLTYPSGRTTTVEYEISRERGVDEIFMKSSLGYFMWESMEATDGELAFVIYWWYSPPAAEVDLQIIERARGLLADPDHWHREDDRKCEDDRDGNVWSLFCALKDSSLKLAGEYNHHNTAIQTVRFVIDDIVPGHGYPHTLMDYNNAPERTHAEILNVLELSRERIAQELQKGDSPNR